jgi:hypothetical protein
MKRSNLSPRSEALAYRIWAFASPRGWDCTSADIAEALGSTPHTVGAVCAFKGWSHRLRGTFENHVDYGGRTDILNALGDVSGRGRLNLFEAPE